MSLQSDSATGSRGRGDVVPGFELAQINVGKLVAPVDSPVVAEFMNALDEVNALGEASDGFVWRLKDVAGNATSFRAFPDPDVIPNLTVWTSPSALRNFAYRGLHRDFFRRRLEWFTLDDSAFAMWWVPAGHRPALGEARRRVEFAAAFGPSPYAFGFASIAEPLTFRRASVDDADALSLITRLNTELDALYPQPGANHFTLTADDVAPGTGILLVASLADRPVACGAIRRTPWFDDSAGGSTFEVKRMFVSHEARGLKLGAAVLSELIGEANDLGATRMVLETGPLQPAALGLYEKFGFRRCACWGEYATTAETSLCMSMDLSA